MAFVTQTERQGALDSPVALKRRYYLCLDRETGLVALRTFTHLADAKRARESYERAHPSAIYAIYDETDTARLGVDTWKIKQAILAFDPARLQRGKRNYVPLRWVSCHPKAEEFVERAMAFSGVPRDEVIAALGAGVSVRHSKPWYALLRQTPL